LMLGFAPDSCSPRSSKCRPTTSAWFSGEVRADPGLVHRPQISSTVRIRLPPLGDPEQGRLIRLKLRRTSSDKPAKRPGEGAWILEPWDSGPIEDAAPRIPQRNLRPFDFLL